MTRKFATCNTCIKSKGGIRLVELHILNETGMVVLLDDEMRIIKPVYDIVNISLHFFLKDVRTMPHPLMRGNIVVS